VIDKNNIVIDGKIREFCNRFVEKTRCKTALQNVEGKKRGNKL